MANIVKGVVKNHIDTAANLITDNIIPLEGEITIESDTLKIKIGDGITSWTTLPYANVAHPVGSTYIQFPGDPTPSTLGLIGTWSNVSSELAGDFIRFEGGNASAFEAGQQLDAMQRITGGSDTSGISTGSNIGLDGVFDGSTLTSTGIFAGGTDGDQIKPLKFDSADSTYPNPAKTNDIETRTVNRTVRKWRRTA